MTAPPTSAELLAVLARSDLLVAAPPVVPAVTGIAADSRSVRPGGLFVAIRGSEQDGHRFAADAVSRGAALLAVEQTVGVPVPEIVVRDGRLAAIALARAWYGDPSRALALLGVTGTSGKTTTVALLRHLLNAGGRAGAIGTLGAFDGSGDAVASTAGALTTPGPVDLQATLAALRERGVVHVAMETSSHSLAQGRLDGLVFAGGVFTNITREHLDYHRTMEDYRAAKLRLVDLLAADAPLAVNADDPAWRSLLTGGRAIGFGQGADAAVRATDLVLGAAGARFTVTGRHGRADIALPLPGEFNVQNAMGALALALGLGCPLPTLAERLAGAPQVPGRMERLVEEPFVVIRDYAHKPDALERVLRTLRPLTAGRLVVLFGCGGDRDRGKRPIMGRLATELADLAIVTSDNPRTEDPERILDDIVAGVPEAASYRRIPDRRAAIGWALETAQPGDTLVLAGKGHETYQVLGTTTVPFDERVIVQDLLGGRP